MKPREARQKVLVGARMCRDGNWSDVKILDASSRGFLVQSSNSPPRGTYIELCRGRNRYVARVVWQAGQRCGVQTQDAVSILDLVKPIEAQKAVNELDRRAEERRKPSRASASLNQRAELSRHLGRLTEYAATVGLGALAAACIFGLLTQVLRKPLDSVSMALNLVIPRSLVAS